MASNILDVDDDDHHHHNFFPLSPIWLCYCVDKRSQLLGALWNLDLLLLLWQRHFDPLASCAAPLASLDLFYLWMVMIIAVLHDNTDTNGSRRSAMALPAEEIIMIRWSSRALLVNILFSPVYRELGETISCSCIFLRTTNSWYYCSYLFSA